MPVTCSIVYGIPTHRLITMIVTLASMALVQNGIDSFMSPRFLRSTLTAPDGCSMMFMIISETNWGTAMESTKQNLQNPFHLVSFLLMTIASIIPRM